MNNFKYGHEYISPRDRSHLRMMVNEIHDYATQMLEARRHQRQSVIDHSTTLSTPSVNRFRVQSNEEIDDTVSRIVNKFNITPDKRNPLPEQKKSKIYLVVTKLIRIFVSTFKKLFS